MLAYNTKPILLVERNLFHLLGIISQKASQVANMHTPIFSMVVYNTINLYETLYKIKMILEIQTYKMITGQIKPVRSCITTFNLLNSSLRNRYMIRSLYMGLINFTKITKV